MKKKKNNKHKYVSFYATNTGLTSKVIIILVFAMILNSLNIAVFAKIFNSGKDNIEYTFNEIDLSTAPNILEVNGLRTEKSKTYLKETGMYETEYYLLIVKLFNPSIVTLIPTAN